MVIEKNFDLTNFNSYRLKSVCKTAYFPETENDFLSLVNLKDSVVIGRGYNIILSKPFYDLDFIIISDSFSKFTVENEIIQAKAGANMYDLSNEALNNSLSGLEYFCDIPGSLGGAIVMNAGSNGIEIKDILDVATYFDPKAREIKSIDQSKIQFTYRDSLFQRNPDFIVLSATLKLVDRDSELIRKDMELIRERRWSKQPKEYPNAGSVFKRPEGRFVGPMIEELGLKGFSIGGAQISNKHAGFIVNSGKATGQDILSLINHVQEKVYLAYGVELEVEQRII